jgi:hypothetical protein
MLQREGSGKLINTSDDETAGHNGTGFTDVHAGISKKFQIALGIISLIKSNNGRRLYFDSLCPSLDLDQNTLCSYGFTR